MEAPTTRRPAPAAGTAPRSISKPRRKRTLTEARKAQNRLAQQAYRQRQKERLRELESQSSRSDQPAKERVLLPQVTAALDTDPPSIFQECAAGLGGEGDLGEQFCIFDFEVPLGVADVGIEEHPRGDGGVEGAGGLTYDIDADVEYQIQGAPDISSSMPAGIGVGQTSISTSTSTAPFTAAFDEIDIFAPPPTSTGLCQDFLDVSTLTRPPPNAAHPSSLSQREQVDTPRTTALTLEAAILDDKVGLEQIVSAGLEVLLNRRPIQPTPRSLSRTNPSRFSSPLSDPYANSLRFVRASTFTAYLNNARALHMDIPALFAERCPSPFYRPSSPTSDLSALHKSVLRAFPTIPAHLRPTLPQILYPHHPYLDLLPFPVLRARAIALANMGTAVYDPQDLKRDIVREGLICWRSSDRTGSGSGQPWDGRSWEAAGWFLKKWRPLVGGEEGDLWSQSVWWRRMRDEGEG